MDRLARWLEPFEPCFGHVAQGGAFRRYLHGLLSNSPRKSMSSMLTRIHDPGSYQAFQHFITHAPWDVAPVWRRLLSRIPDRRGVLILDDTGFPKQGTHSVGVQRQYSGTLGKIGNCRIAVTAALWTGVRAWLLGAELYLPQPWFTVARRQLAHIPARVRFQEKWRLALTLVDRVRRAGIAIEWVTADAGYGDILDFRTGWRSGSWRMCSASLVNSPCGSGGLRPNSRRRPVPSLPRPSAPSKWRPGRRSNPRVHGGASPGAMVHTGRGTRAFWPCASRRSCCGDSIGRSRRSGSSASVPAAGPRAR